LVVRRGRTTPVTKESQVVIQRPKVQRHACLPLQHMITARRLRIDKSSGRDPRVYRGPEQSNRKNDMLTPGTIDKKTWLGMNQPQMREIQSREGERKQRHSQEGIDVTPLVTYHLELPEHWAATLCAPSTTPYLTKKGCDVKLLHDILERGKEREMRRVPSWRRHNRRRKSQFLIRKRGHARQARRDKWSLLIVHL
jgi:hypothetical protein